MSVFWCVRCVTFVVVCSCLHFGIEKHAISMDRCRLTGSDLSMLSRNMLPAEVVSIFSWGGGGGGGRAVGVISPNFSLVLILLYLIF